MKSERDFLAAIAAAPNDRTVRLVYADWLEERGDARGKMVRAEEEMRTLAPYSDRYWSLKPIRDRGRLGCDRKWLDKMGYRADTDYQPILGDIPDGWRERWRLLRAWVERWHKIPVGDIGSQRTRIADVEKTVGYSLPPSVQEWIAFVYDVLDAKAYERVFRDAISFEEVEGQSAFSLMIQGEADYHWTVRKEHLRTEDPPVDGYALDYETEESRFIHDRPIAKRVTTWAFQFLIAYLDISGAGGFGGNLDAPSTARVIEEMKASFPVFAEFDDVRVFEAPNVVADVSPMPYSSDESTVSVHVWRPIALKLLPPCVRNLAAHWRSGTFAR
jgi:uncharacterized protein (TIGR02996 family)